MFETVVLDLETPVESTSDKGEKTAQRLLESACQIFSKKGFRDATVAEICADANANIAAINYHYGSKEKLYHAAWEHADARAEALYPFDAGHTHSPEEWVCHLIRSRVMAILDEGPAGWLPQLIGREMSAPTPLMPALREEFLGPKRARLHAMICELLGSKATPLQVDCCVNNVISLFVFFNLRRQADGKLLRREDLQPDQLQTLIVQVQEFALAGIRGVRSLLEKEQA